MRTEVVDMLDIVGPWLPGPPLLSREAWPPIRRVGRGLPPAFQFGVIECRLGRAEQRVDFLVGASALFGGRQAMKDCLARDEVYPSIEPFRNLLGAWAADDGWPFEIPVLCCEYDLPFASEAPPSAMLLGIGLNPNHLAPGSVPDATPRARRLATEHALRLLGDPTPDPAPLDVLERCAEALPHGGVFSYVAPLTPRNLPQLRLVAELPGGEVLGWLDRIGWRDRYGGFDLWKSVLGTEWDRVGIQLELTKQGVGSYLAAEIYLADHQRHAPAAWRLLERARELGASDPEKARAALEWMGIDVLRPPDVAWPLRVHRGHILKLILLPGAELEVKSYLGYHLQYVV